MWESIDTILRAAGVLIFVFGGVKYYGLSRAFWLLADATPQDSEVARSVQGKSKKLDKAISKKPNGIEKSNSPS